MQRPETFVENYQRALANPSLQKALATATGKALDSRQQAVADIGEENWQQLRARARAIKEHTIDNLDYYLAQLAANVELSGGRVYWAQTAADARRYITDLAAQRNVKIAVKSKSMMTEEIDLNQALHATGIEAVETDLGEYIVQLANERPSHINMPAIHKTRADVADLFTHKLGVERNEDISQMALLARQVLRRRFAAAQMGITGVNYAIAETGTIVLVENEGNIRLTNSLPRVHVAVMGIEKVIPRLSDLDVFMKLLSRSASGQKICSYVSLLSGVKASQTDEGPDEFHLVILDNGRVEMLANPALRESLFCIRCGACLNVCPVYQKIGGHAYGWVYPGPIGAVLTPQMIGRERAAALPFASTLCGACKDVCPVKINIPQMLLHLRQEIKDGTPRNGGVLERTIFRTWAAATKTSLRYRIAARAARVVQRLFGRKNKDGARVFSFPRWTTTRDAPPLAARSFRESWAELFEGHNIIREQSADADANRESSRATRTVSVRS